MDQELFETLKREVETSRTLQRLLDRLIAKEDVERELFSTIPTNNFWQRHA